MQQQPPRLRFYITCEDADADPAGVIDVAFEDGEACRFSSRWVAAPSAPTHGSLSRLTGLTRWRTSPPQTPGDLE